MEEAARSLQDKWQKACEAIRGKRPARGGKGRPSSSTPPPPTREAYRAEAERAWQRLVRRVRVWGPFAATAPDATDFDDLRTNVTYRIEKDLDRLTGNRLVDEDCWQGKRRMIWSDGRVDDFDR